MAIKRRGAEVDGLLLLDKAEGFTSNGELQRAKRLLDARKAGHTGSLDPIATGLLPLCFGAATKISSLFLDADKTYEAEIRLGAATDSGDRAGKVIREAAINFSEAELQSALDKLRARREQIPPMVSALKHDGQRLYKLARAGKTVERAPRSVTIHALNLLRWRGDTISLEISCSRGFYVRVLAADLGEMLGCGAHVHQLRRTRVGHFELKDACSIADLESLPTPAARREKLLTVEQSVAHLPAVELPANLAQYTLRGRTVRLPAASQCAPAAERAARATDTAADGSAATDTAAAASAKPANTAEKLVRVYAAGAGFIGIAAVAGDGKLTPKRLFQTA